MFYSIIVKKHEHCISYVCTSKVINLLFSHIKINYFFIIKSEEVFHENKNAFSEVNSSIWVQRIQCVKILVIFVFASFLHGFYNKVTSRITKAMIVKQ